MKICYFNHFVTLNDLMYFPMYVIWKCFQMQKWFDAALVALQECRQGVGESHVVLKRIQELRGFMIRFSTHDIVFNKQYVSKLVLLYSSTALQTNNNILSKKDWIRTCVYHSNMAQCNTVRGFFYPVCRYSCLAHFIFIFFCTWRKKWFPNL